ncbi:hypothetical protein Dimus_037753, partial [Dionaea muscipula]
ISIVFISIVVLGELISIVADNEETTSVADKRFWSSIRCDFRVANERRPRSGVISGGFELDSSVVSLNPNFPSSDLLIFVVDFMDFLGFRVGVCLGVDLAAGGAVVPLARSGEVVRVCVA